MLRHVVVTLVVIGSMSAIPVGAQLPAFPGGEGFGAAATGGRGGQVLIVTTLDPSGTGSLQWALDQSGPRIIVFEVSGVIEGDIRIPSGNVTIAGQTAPGAGITVHGHLFADYGADYGNLIIRHVRVRSPVSDATWPPAQHDTVQFSTHNTLMFDHVDFSHGIDEIIDLWGGATGITVQWSKFSFPVYGGGHPDGEDHNYGLINGPGGGRISVHHTLFAHCKTRTPALAEGPADVVNNVVYNASESFVHHNPVDGDFNLIGNSYLDGPSANLVPFWFDPENTPPPPSRYWVWGNWVDDPGVFVGRVDNPFTTPGFSAEYTFYCCGITPGQFNAVGEFDFSGTAGYVPITKHDAATAMELVLEGAGAWPRDVVAHWAVDETRSRSGSWGDHRPSDWLQGLTPGTAPPDLDRDGMADSWESQNGLDSSDGDDHGTVMPSGYTAIEEYINQLADAIQPFVFLDGFESGGSGRWSDVHG